MTTAGKGHLEVLAATLTDTCAFDGCISVEMFVVANHPDDIVLIEGWDSRAQQKQHLVWRVGGGMMELLVPILAGSLELRYLEPSPA